MTVEISATKKVDLWNLTLTRHFEGKRSRNKYRITCLTSLCKLRAEDLMGEMVAGQTLLRFVKDRKLWIATIAHEKKESLSAETYI